MLPKLLTVILASILVGLVAAVGFLLCIVPGVIFMLWFALAIQVIVIEGQGVTASMARSKELVKGNMGKVFLVGLILFLIGLLVGGVATGISIVLRAALGMRVCRLRDGPQWWLEFHFPEPHRIRFVALCLAWGFGDP